MALINSNRSRLLLGCGATALTVAMAMAPGDRLSLSGFPIGGHGVEPVAATPKFVVLKAIKSAVRWVRRAHQCSP